MAAQQAKYDKLSASRDIYVNRLNELAIIANQVLDDKSKIPEFKVRISKVDQIYKNLENFHMKCVSVVAETPIENTSLEHEEEIRVKVDDNYFKIKTIYDTLVETNANDLDQSLLTSSSSSSTTATKLPKLTLPTFDGTLKQWPNFRDLYKRSVHERNDLSPIEKFHYLLTNTTGEPQEILKGVTLSNDGYPIAWSNLLKRYENKRLLASSYWTEIINFPKIEKENNAQLRKIINIFGENLTALQLLEFPVNSWDFPMFNIMLEKLDPSTRTRFELEFSSKELPSYNDLISFVTNQCKALETLTLASSSAVQFLSPINVKPRRSALIAQTAPISNKRCTLCSQDHQNWRCPKLLTANPNVRYQLAKEHQLCLNCLRAGHKLERCNSKFACKTCNSKVHHSLLHFDPVDQPNFEEISLLDSSSSSQEETNTLVSHQKDRTILLSTAEVFVKDFRGRKQKVRALLDNGSQVNLMTIDCAKKLGLQYSNSVSAINGIGNSCPVNSNGKCRIEVSPVKSSQPTFNIEVYILPKICGDMPSHTFSPLQSHKLAKLPLADPEYFKSRPIDMLLSSEIFYRVLAKGKLTSNPDEPMAVKTLFGWIICGEIRQTSLSNQNCTPIIQPHSSTPFEKSSSFRSFPASHNSQQSSLQPHLAEPRRLKPRLLDSYCSIPQKISSSEYPSSLFVSNALSPNSDVELNRTLRQFWELEEVPHSREVDREVQQCENFYRQTTKRDPTGRYIVKLPFKNNSPPQFGDSKTSAIRSLLAVERRFKKDKDLQKQYADFMQDYLSSGHMTKVLSSNFNEMGFFIPHHCVLKPDSTSTKLRVVFNASRSSKNGLSLNDTLLVGPKLQLDISTLLCKFRLHPVVFTADIRQMYRQILIAPEDRCFQKIVWRFAPEDRIEEYVLNTVTYGVTSAPFLALRTVRQLALDHGEQYPLAKNVLLNDVYVDDVISGCQSLEGAGEVIRQLMDLCKQGGFQLRKWTSNIPELLGEMPSSMKQEPLEFETPAVKVLGLRWHPTSDVFSYQVNTISSRCTKRSILSELSRIFDPLGFLAPITFFAKHLTQLLWKLQLKWDDPAPSVIAEQWDLFKSQLRSLSTLQVPRHLGVGTICELHGFCDASEKGFGGIVYLRSKTGVDYRTYLLMAKSKVAPLKTQCIPRLELCATVLLAKMLDFIRRSYQSYLNIENVYAWTDSSIALCWIRSPSYRWQTFVANRTSLIHSLVESSCWYHVKSQDNPADIVSRGALPNALLADDQYWHGPEWLYSQKLPINSPFENSPEEALIEEKRTVLLVSAKPESILSLLDKFSSLDKILRILCYCFKFISGSILKLRLSPSISISELDFALMTLVRLVQQDYFLDDLTKIQKGESPSKALRKLSPFVDGFSVLRVGGRLALSQLTYDQKHPILLPRQHRLTELIVQLYHRQFLHPGLQTLQFLIAQKFWILSARRAIRQFTSNCISCFRNNPKPFQPLMGSLPSFRVNEVKAFSCTGVDFGGPFLIRTNRLRNSRLQKAYICLFVCSTTKAVHIELASELSTDCFLAALRRFIGRRGRCVKLFSDCGTNFVGAQRYLHEICAKVSSIEQIEWSFNPAATPHFGGLYEAGIKSVKNHLKRLIGEQHLTYEEFNTVLIQIEAVLNSRPLVAMSSDPNDFSVLTPGHFLTLEPLTALPDPDLSTLNINRLNRWQLLNRLHSDFWRRWSTEYLHSLMQRSKWTEPGTRPCINDLVLLKDERLPPLKWKLGRIAELISGRDGEIRVAKVKTPDGFYTRGVTKLCPLPKA